MHLGPFFLRRINEQSKSPEIYVYNDAWRTKLEYISYESGAYYYHKELHSDFQELLNIKLRPGIDEDAYRFLATEERAQRAEDAFKRGLMFVEKAQYENALEFFELSAELERRSATLLEMAKTQKMLGEPQDAILQNLQHCLELEPENREGLELQQKLSQHGVHTQEETPEREDLPDGSGSLLTFFHLLCPKALLPYAEFFWLTLLFSWYALSAGSEYLAGDADKIFFNVLQCSLGTLIILCVVTGKRLFLRLRIPLSFQLDSMRLERFERWFQQQSGLIFGHIRRDKTRVVYQYGRIDEKLFIGLSVSIVVPAGVIGYVMCELYTAPFVFMLKRWLDNMIVVILLGLVIFRYIFASSIFIYRFSKLSLKPMLTKMGDDGFRAFSPFIVSNLSFVSAGFLSYLALGHAEFSHPFPLDLLFLAIGVIFFIAWSFGMPITLRMAARQAKSKSILRYLQHIENAFHEFLNEPDETRLKTYSWLLEEQKVIQAISTWPLGWKATVFAVIGSNLVMLHAVAWYVLSRLGQWPAVLEWILETLQPV